MTKLKEIIIDQIAKTLVKFNKSINEFQVKFTKHTVSVHANTNSVVIKFGKFTKDEVVVHYHKWINYLYKKIAELLEQASSSSSSNSKKTSKSSKPVEPVEPVEPVGQADQVDQVLEKVVDQVLEQVEKANDQANNQENKISSFFNMLFGRK